jgi:hypothetical protein
MDYVASFVILLIPGFLQAQADTTRLGGIISPHYDTKRHDSLLSIALNFYTVIAVYSTTVASDSSFAPARCCNTIFAGVLTGVLSLTCYKRQGSSALSIALVALIDSFGCSFENQP